MKQIPIGPGKWLDVSDAEYAELTKRHLVIASCDNGPPSFYKPTNFQQQKRQGKDDDPDPNIG